MATREGLLADVAAQVKTVDDLCDSLTEEFHERISHIRCLCEEILSDLDRDPELEVDDDGS